jgi:Flp pilus assembly protein TadG
MREMFTVVRTRNRKGSSIVETAAGLILLIPIVLFLVDVAAMVVAQTENDKLAKACARAAAEYPSNSGPASTAANLVYTNQKNSTLLSKQSLTGPTYATVGMVTCQTNIKCNLPVPVPFIGTPYVMFSAKATEPVVGELP